MCVCVHVCVYMYMVVFLVCAFQLGDGHSDGDGVSEILVGSGLTARACISACLERKKSDESINGVTVLISTIPAKCWCEQNMTRISTHRQIYKTCFLQGKT